MDPKQFRFLGVILFIAAGVLFTIERATAVISRSQELVAEIARNCNNCGPDTQIPRFWDNGFVPILAIAGVVLFVYSFAKK